MSSVPVTSLYGGHEVKSTLSDSQLTTSELQRYCIETLTKHDNMVRVLDVIRDRSERKAEKIEDIIWIIFLPFNAAVITPTSWDRFINWCKVKGYPEWGIKDLETDRCKNVAGLDTSVHFVFTQMLAVPNTSHGYGWGVWGNWVNALSFKLLGTSSYLKSVERREHKETGRAMTINKIPFTKVQRRWAKVEDNRKFNELILLFKVLDMQPLSGKGIAAEATQTLIDIDRKNLSQCFLCKKAGKTMLCGGCQCISFCSKQCSERFWPQHKLACAGYRINFPPATSSLIRKFESLLNVYAVISPKMTKGYKLAIKEVKTDKQVICIIMFGNVKSISDCILNIETKGQLTPSPHISDLRNLSRTNQYQIEFMSMTRFIKMFTVPLGTEAIMRSRNDLGMCPIQIYLCDQTTGIFSSWPVMSSHKFGLEKSRKETLRSFVTTVRKGAEFV